MSTPLHPSNETSSEHSPKFHIANQQPRPLWQDVCIGSISALAVMPFIQPMTYFKNVQQSRSITFLKCLKENPRAWYRGLLGSTAFFAPTIAAQTAAQDLFATVMHPILAASASGAFSAIVVCPAEGIMIQQQKTGHSLWTTMQRIHALHGKMGFYKALGSTAVREAVFTSAYLGIVPSMKFHLQDLGLHEGSAQILSGVVVGSIASAASHPIDTFKTQRQTDLSCKISIIETIFKKTAFIGFGWRWIMIMTGSTTIPYVQEKLYEKIKQP